MVRKGERDGKGSYVAGRGEERWEEKRVVRNGGTGEEKRND